MEPVGHEQSPFDNRMQAGHDHEGVGQQQVPAAVLQGHAFTIFHPLIDGLYSLINQACKGFPLMFSVVFRYPLRQGQI